MKRKVGYALKKGNTVQRSKRPTGHLVIWSVLIQSEEEAIMGLTMVSLEIF